MNYLTYLPSLAIILVGLLFIFVPLFKFYNTQCQLLKSIRFENRKLIPGRIWLQLIPIFGNVYQFHVCRRIALSIYAELSAPVNGELPELPRNRLPTYVQGLTLAILFPLISINILIVQVAVFLATLIVGVFYWISLNDYKKKIEARLIQHPKQHIPISTIPA